MKISFTTYMVIKIILIILSMYLFFHHEIFNAGGYDLSVDGVVICRCISLIFAIYTTSGLVDTIYKK